MRAQLEMIHKMVKITPLQLSFKKMYFSPLGLFGGGGLRPLLLEMVKTRAVEKPNLKFLPFLEQTSETGSGS